MFRRIVGGLVDAAGRRPAIVLVLSLIFMIASWGYARNLELRSDFLELLPRDSPGFKAFEHQLGRVGGGATFLVVVESPDRKANERVVDDLGGALENQVKTREDCVKACADDACKQKCGPDYISYVERGTKDLQSFFDQRKWLYASLKDLEEADETLDHQIAIRSELVTDLEAPDEPAPAPAAPHAAAGAPKTKSNVAPGVPAPAPAPEPAANAAPDPNAKQATLGMDRFYDRWKNSSTKYNDFPTGYFANEAGTVMVIRIVSNASGTGGATGDLFLAEMKKRVDELRVREKYHPQMTIGFAGDIPNAVAEKESTLSEAAWASGLAFLLILGGIVVYYRSPWSLLVISIPVLMGIGAAYAFATAVFGYVNTPGAFLGAIILGNGINYPIVLLSRYREFRARGMERTEARREAVLNAFRAELVGASVASIAYGSLTITHFRGFSQFGTIGFVGMFLVWLAIVPVVPALIVVVENIQAKLPPILRDPPAPVRSDGSGGVIIRWIAKITERWPAPFIIVPLVATIFCATKLPSYLKDPWEYNFSKLGSRSSKASGAGEWSNRADEVFRGKQNISGTLILADTPEQVPLLEEHILANDRADKEGQLIDDIVTVQDFLPGPAEEQKQKLAVLERMRDRLTPRVLHEVGDQERQRLEELRPPEDLDVTTAKDLPPLIRRRFEENQGKLGTLMYVKYKYGVSFSDGRTLLRMAKTTDNVSLPDGTVVQTASRSTIFAEMIRSMEHDGPLATGASFLAVAIVVVIATRSRVGTFSVLLALLMGVVCLLGGAAMTDIKLNFFNFIALPITFGIGCEYPFNVFDRTRILKSDVTGAVARTGGAVALCSYTTTVGYGSMLFSDNQALQSFGRLAAWGEVACTVMALLFLPSLLHIMLRTKAKKAAEAAQPSP
ncbi:efflux RND transporter permease subunit [Labilithrix luteola]|uniref:efflux RND transporter permease subunit n=1 Tax=Labilithrix luteola TaxID=1391654 RepID=UPI0011BAAD9E|nr:MMPL family transporter [Labilithrix luteola]